MSLGRPKAILELTAEEQQELAGFAASGSLSHALVSRARLVLWSAEGRSNSGIAGQLNWSKAHGRQVAAAVCRAPYPGPL